MHIIFLSLQYNILETLKLLHDTFRHIIRRHPTQAQLIWQQ